MPRRRLRTIPMECRKCTRMFKAKHRFNKICGSCTKANEKMALLPCGGGHKRRGVRERE